MFKFNFKKPELNAFCEKMRAERIKRDKEIKTTIEKEGQFLSQKVLETVFKHMKENNKTVDSEISITIDNLIAFLFEKVEDYKTCILVEGRSNDEPMTNYELNIDNIRRALSKIFTSRRVWLGWYWKPVKGETIKRGARITPPEILAHPDARLEIHIKAKK